MNKKITVGSELDSYCGSGNCKMVLNHVVVAMVDDVPKRVRCLTCGSEHNHRVTKAKTTKAKSSTTKTKRSTSRSTKSASKANKWSTLITSWDEGLAKTYSIYDSFQVNDLLTHSKFGKGFVTDVPAPDRILTLFESGEKLLMHGRARG